MSDAPNASNAAAAAKPRDAPKSEDLLGGGVLKKQFDSITGHFAKFDTSKISAQIKSGQGEGVSFLVSGERTHAVKGNPDATDEKKRADKPAGQDATAKFLFSKKNLSFSVAAKASAKVIGDVSLSNAFPNSTIKASAEHGFDSCETTVKSSIDFKFRNVTATAAFEYPFGKGVKADLSAVAQQSGFALGGRLVVKSTLGDDKAAKAADKKASFAAVDDYELALGYGRDRVVVGVAATQKLDTLSLGIASKVHDKATVSGIASFSLTEKKPKVDIGVNFVASPTTYQVRASGSIPTGDVAVQLNSRLFRNVNASVSLKANAVNRSHGYGVSLDVDN